MTGTEQLLNNNQFAELGSAIRHGADGILREWERRVREEVRAAAPLSHEQFIAHQPEILLRLAEALESSLTDSVPKLAAVGPNQGVSRFENRYEIEEVLAEDAILRQVVLDWLPRALCRPLTPLENVAFNAAVDLVMQHGTLAYFRRQRERLRLAAEAELTYLAFLSHDLNNHLNSVSVWLEVLRRRLSTVPGFDPEVTALVEARRTIADIINSMRQLLEHERLRKFGCRPEPVEFDLHALAADVVRSHAAHAEQKGLQLVLTGETDTRVSSDAHLISLILRNLVGNAIKFSDAGVVRVSVNRKAGDDDMHRSTVAVSDQGPGIAAEHIGGIFEAFRRGDAERQPGVGLGLAIAAQAARLLDAKLTVESAPGSGSTFRLAINGR